MAIASSLAFFLLLFPFAAQSQPPFTFHTFKDTDLTIDGASTINPNGLLQLTNSSLYVTGHAFYPQPIQMFNRTSGNLNSNVSSFSTSFVFAIVPTRSNNGGYGFAFALSPSTQFSKAGQGHYLGLFDSSNDRNVSNNIFAVEFDTVRGVVDDSDIGDQDHVGINNNSVSSIYSTNASYLINGTPMEVDLESGDLIRAWIEYDGLNKLVNVTISPSSMEKPTEPLISYPIDLGTVVRDEMYVGFSASTGMKSSFHYISGWSFAVNGPAPTLNVSQLAKPPKDKVSSAFRFQTKVLIAVLSVLIPLGILCFVILFKMMKHESLEEWELDCPHRFSYNDLYTATRGFKETEIIGVGGFGVVYKGVLRSGGCEVAVKKVMRNSIHGMREFAAEIESLGRLRHKNLVNLQGWCKKKNNLLIVYDYIPNGSLDHLLHYPKDNHVLNWEQRFKIVNDIAAGLLYLHEEWEQIVIHRDVKPSNVLIDTDMGARLSDFGLARLHDHGEISSHTTDVVGTIGYLAPEMARTGKASKSTDVFAFGVLLLEVASGRKPIESGQFIVDWIWDCHEMGVVPYAADPRLNSVYDFEEIDLVLQLGLLCSHQQPEVRPTMRQITRYLNKDDLAPAIDSWSSSRRIFKTNLRFSSSIRNLEINSSFNSYDLTTSYRSSSIGAISSTSLNDGR